MLILIYISLKRAVHALVFALAIFAANAAASWSMFDSLNASRVTTMSRPIAWTISLGQ